MVMSDLQGCTAPLSAARRRALFAQLRQRTVYNRVHIMGSVIAIAAGVIAISAWPHAPFVRSSPARLVVDSRMTVAQALKGTRAPLRVRRSLALVTVRYLGFDGRRHEGQIVVRKDLATEVVGIFCDLERLRFPIAKVVPIVRYGWSDARSMADNNTSGFNYRTKVGESGLSRHALGAAIDINPKQNPYVLGRTNLPPGARYRPGTPGTMADGPVVRAFTTRGWRWGGRFRRHRDWQHFYRAGAAARRAR